MKHEAMIQSLLENDLYKFSMGQVIYHQFPSYTTTWAFKCRNKDTVFTQEMLDEINAQIDNYCQLYFTEDELNYLRTIKWIKSDYIDFLRLWHPRREEIKVTLTEGRLDIKTRGTWLNTSMYEVPLLAIVNEVFFRENYNYEELEQSFKNRLLDKLINLNRGVDIGNFSEFGLRRRLSRKTQDELIATITKYQFNDSHFVGTSNVYLAKKYGVKPVGTMAHEFIMCVGQGNHKHNPAYSNYYMMQAWVKEYGILNGTALTDTITTDNFLKDFDLTYATLFSGVRHDSGNPYHWGEKMIKHYQNLGIDPKTKTLLFSDGLNFAEANALRTRFKNSVNVAFGIGTYLSNDTEVPALNIVLKVIECNGQPVAKISDVTGKGMCQDPNYIDYLNRAIKWRKEHE